MIQDRAFRKQPQPKPWELPHERLPPLSTEEEIELERDIQKEGALYPIKVLPDGRIVDGFSRWKLSKGKAPVEVANIDDESTLGLRLNLERRQPSQEQKEHDAQHAETQAYKAQADSVSLLNLKQLAQQMLPRSSHLRALILSEPDSLSREQAIAKLEVFSRLLYRELPET